MKAFPKEFSRVWWRLWFAGAIDKRPVYLRHLADALHARKQNDDGGYYVEDPDAVRRGDRLPSWSRGFLDLTAVVAQDLRLLKGEQDPFVIELIGKTAQESDQVWQEKKS